MAGKSLGGKIIGRLEQLVKSSFRRVRVIQGVDLPVRILDYDLQRTRRSNWRHNLKCIGIYKGNGGGYASKEDPCS